MGHLKTILCIVFDSQGIRFQVQSLRRLGRVVHGLYMFGAEFQGIKRRRYRLDEWGA